MKKIEKFKMARFRVLIINKAKYQQINSSKKKKKRKIILQPKLTKFMKNCNNV